MKPIRRVLVAVKDPGARSQPVASKAAQIARGLRARVELFHALDAPLYVDLLATKAGSLEQVKTELRTRREHELERMSAMISRTGVDVTTRVEWDFPAYEAIIRRARRMRAELIIADCHTGRHLAARLLRLTDWELLRFSPVPVLLVKSPRRYRRPVVLAAIDPTRANAKPARFDDAILSLGRTVTSALDGTLHAVHAWVPALLSSGPADLQAKAAVRARVQFNRALRSSGIAPARRHLVARYPEDGILDIARSRRSSIIVMGAMSRSGFAGFLFGNTADRVLDRLPCDLLIARPSRFVSRVPLAMRGPRLAIAVPAV